MDFSVDVKQQELIALAKTIAEKEIAPRALRIDKSGVMDEELLEIVCAERIWRSRDRFADRCFNQ